MPQHEKKKSFEIGTWTRVRHCRVEPYLRGTTTMPTAFFGGLAFLEGSWGEAVSGSLRAKPSHRVERSLPRIGVVARMWWWWGDTASSRNYLPSSSRAFSRA